MPGVFAIIRELSVRSLSEKKGKGTMKKMLLGVLLFFDGIIAADACTGLYAGKGVTEDGIVYVARTVDSPPWTAGHRIEVSPRVENVPGRQYRALVNGTVWELPATTWHCVSTPRLTVHCRGRRDSACVNECGVAITGTTTAQVNEKVLAVDPYVEDGFAEESLPGLLGICAASAREAVELLGRAIAAKGHVGTEIYMFADPDEAWYVEVYTGHQWAAVKMPEDAVAVYGNQLMLRAYDPDAPHSLHSPGLVAVAEKAGTLVRLEDGGIDLFKSYSTSIGDYSNYRTWFGHRTLAPETAGEYVADEPGELFYHPSKKVTRRDLFELMRTRYEGVNSPEETGDLKIRTIGTTKQATCHLLEIRPDLPRPFQATMWVALGNAEHVPFLPYNAALDAVETAYAADIRRGDWDTMDLRTASAHFRRLAALAETDRVNRGSGLRKHWRELEERLLGEYPKTLAAAAVLYGEDPAEAKRFITDAARRLQRETLSDAKTQLDKLLWYITANNRIEGDGSGATSKPEQPFACWAPSPCKTKVVFFTDVQHDEGACGPYCRQLDLEYFFPPEPPLDIPALLEELAAYEIVVLKRHGDGPNSNPRDPADVAVYYDRFRALVHALKTDARFEVTDCEELHRTFRAAAAPAALDSPL